MARPSTRGGPNWPATELLAAAVAMVVAGCSDREADPPPRAPPPATVRGAAVYTQAEHGDEARCTIVGTDEDDVLVGSAKDDVVCGLAGDDTISGGAGDDVLAGGPGEDTVSFSSAPRTVRVRLSSKAVGEGRDSLSGFERVVGSAHPDLLDSRDGRAHETVDGAGGTDLCLSDPGDRRTGCGHPWVRSHARPVPILVYHVIGTPAPGTPNSGLWTSSKTLEAQLRYLDRHGYEAVSLQAVYDYWHGAPLPAKPVVLSFDDGFESDYSVAMPLLAAHRWAGVLNLTLTHFERSWGLSRRMVAAMIRGGWELDCHTKTHALLPGLDSRALWREVVSPRRFLQRRFDVPVNFFAYPSGVYGTRALGVVGRAGYEGAVTTADGFAKPGDPFELARIEIVRGDTLRDFALKVAAH
jgi:peptidoglycan/xylan/chitin deacetylase (PgdA/CDA1 family)